LLRRKAAQQQQTETQQQTDDLGEQVRKLSDLYDVRFHYEKNDDGATTTCPITSKVLNGSISAILLVPGKAETPNVVSESAFSLLPETELETEYGPIQQKIRLAPPVTLLEQIKKQVQEQRQKEDLRKHKNSKKKKRKRDVEKVSSSSSSRPKRATTGTEAAKSRVETAIKSNKVLSSLFTSKKSISEKEHKDNLFAR
jgi:hypothetical protein